MGPSSRLSSFCHHPILCVHEHKREIKVGRAERLWNLCPLSPVVTCSGCSPGLLLFNLFMDGAQQQTIYSFCHHPILCVHEHRRDGGGGALLGFICLSVRRPHVVLLSRMFFLSFSLSEISELGWSRKWLFLLTRNS
jgi:hypothetical protein